MVIRTAGSPSFPVKCQFGIRGNSGETGVTRYLIAKYAGSTRTDKDIASTLENSMRRLSFVAAAWELAMEKVSLVDSLKIGESVLLLGSSPKMESTFREFNRAIAAIRQDAPSAHKPCSGWMM